jgi:N-carbamoylputrescine amidase
LFALIRQILISIDKNIGQTNFMEGGQVSMKIALAVPRVKADLDSNLATVEMMAVQAARKGAGIVLFPEAVLTGLINNDDPAHDLPLGQVIPGPATNRLGDLCSRQGIWLAFGMLERDGSRLYDSAVLLKADGDIGLIYRRNQPNWHGKKVDSDVYCQGTDIPFARTSFGTVAFLLCGDLFDDAIVSRFSNLAVDWMLVPFARSFPDGTINQARWDSEELPLYAKRVRMSRTPAFMVNYLADDSLTGDKSFGGSLVISAGGDVLAAHPLGEEGILIVNMDSMLQKRIDVPR